MIGLLKTLDTGLVFAMMRQGDSVPPARMTQAAREALLLFGALLPVVALLVIWALFLRRKRKRRHHHREHHGVELARSVAGPGTEGESGASARRHHRHRHRQRSRFPLNPTLAQIGGLPGRRPGDAGPPPGSAAPPAPR